MTIAIDQIVLHPHEVTIGTDTVNKLHYHSIAIESRMMQLGSGAGLPEVNECDIECSDKLVVNSFDLELSINC
jgi:hypothetical protein